MVQQRLRDRIGEEAYSEIKRKAGSARTKGYFGWLKENDPDKLREIVNKRNNKNK